MKAALKACRTPVNLRIVGRDLPGRHFGDRDAVHVGIQRGTQVVELVPGDADVAVFSFSVDVVTTAEGGPDFRGAFVHGRRGERFLYLSWGQVDASGRFDMFRRAKLHLSVLGEQDIARALRSGAVIEATLGLTDARGGPLCASVRPPTIRWRVDMTVDDVGSSPPLL